MDLGGFIGDLVHSLLNGVLEFLGTLVAALLDLMADLVRPLIEMLPVHIGGTFSIPSGWLTGYALLNTFLPLAEALAFAALFVTLHAAFFTWRLTMGIWRAIRG